MMKTKNLLTLAVIASLPCLFAGCGSSKNAANTAAVPNVYDATEHMSEVEDYEYDTKEYYAATGIAHGSFVRFGQVQLAALQNAKEMVYEKVAHKYTGMVKNYMNMYGDDKGTDIVNKLERGGEATIQTYLNDIEATKVKKSRVDEEGNIFVYVNIRVDKKALAREIAKANAKDLSSAEKSLIDFQADEFEKELAQEFEK